MTSHSRRYREALDKIKQEHYTPAEAVELTKEFAPAKFNETIELHLHTTADTRQQGQQLRETTSLPSGTGKPIAVMVFAAGEHHPAAKEAGADFVSDEPTLAKIEQGWTEFNAAIATQDMMPKIAKLGRVLGRKGLMPSPRSGTVVKPEEIAQAVSSAKLGRVEIRIDKGGSIHVPIGVIEFDKDQILANLNAVIGTIMAARPKAIKGAFITSATLATTMGPGVRIDPEKLSNADDSA